MKSKRAFPEGWPKRVLTTISVLLVVLATARASAQGLQRIRPQRLALIVGIDGKGGEPAEEPATASQRSLADLLRRELGYRPENVRELYNEAATRGAIMEALSGLLQRAGEGDSLFAYLSLGTVGEGDSAFVVPADGRPDDPWTLIPFFELEKMLFGPATTRAGSRPSWPGTTFLVLPRCNGGWDIRQTPSRNVPRQRDVAQAVSVLAFCPVVGDQDRGRALFARSLLEGMKGQKTHPEGRFAASALYPYLLKSAGALALRFSKDPEYADDFVFVVESDRLTPFLTRLKEATSAEAKESAISEIVKQMLSSSEDQRRRELEPVGAAMLGLASDAQEHPLVRRRAVRALGELNPPASAAKLARLFETSPDDPTLRQATVDSLARMGGDSVLPPLRSALADRSPAVRLSAVRALGSLRDGGAVEELLELLPREPEAEVRVAALQTLAVLKPVSPQARQTVIRLLGDPVPAVRAEAVSTLGSLGGSLAMPEVFLLLREDKDAGVRETVAYSLGRAFQAADRLQTEGALLAVLDGRDVPAVREAAAWSLGQIGGPTAEGRLIRCLKDPAEDAWVRRAAAEGLGKMRSTRAVEALSVSLATAREPEVRRAAAIALGAIGDARAAEPLFAALKDDDDAYVRAEAEKALRRTPTSEAEFREKLDDPSSQVRAEAVRRLAVGSKPALAGDLVRMLDDSDYEVRQAAVQALTDFKDEVTFSRVLRALGDKYSFLKRQGAAAVLGLQGRMQAVKPLRHHEDPNSGVRAEVARALGRLYRSDSPADVASDIEQGLLAAAEDKDTGVRQAAAEGLGRVGTRMATAALQRLARDPVPEVRQAAIEALRKTSVK